MFAAGVLVIVAVAGALLVGYAAYAIIRAGVRDGMLQAQQQSFSGGGGKARGRR